MGTGDLEAVGMVTPLLAHMGGIDEVGIFVIPAVLAIWALRRAERLARQRAEAEPEGTKQPEAIAEDTGTKSA